MWSLRRLPPPPPPPSPHTFLSFAGAVRKNNCTRPRAALFGHVVKRRARGTVKRQYSNGRLLGKFGKSIPGLLHSVVDFVWSPDRPASRKEPRATGAHKWHLHGCPLRCTRVRIAACHFETGSIADQCRRFPIACRAFWLFLVEQSNFLRTLSGLV